MKVIAVFAQIETTCLTCGATMVRLGQAKVVHGQVDVTATLPDSQRVCNDCLAALDANHRARVIDRRERRACAAGKPDAKIVGDDHA